MHPNTVTLLLAIFITSLSINFYYYYYYYALSSGLDADSTRVNLGERVGLTRAITAADGSCEFNGKPLILKPVTLDEIKNPNTNCLCGPGDNYCLCSPSIDIAIAIVLQADPDASPEQSELLLTRGTDGVSLVTGLVQIGESYEDAAERELREQIGLNRVGDERPGHAGGNEMILMRQVKCLSISMAWDASTGTATNAQDGIDRVRCLFTIKMDKKAFAKETGAREGKEGVEVKGNKMLLVPLKDLQRSSLENMFEMKSHVDFVYDTAEYWS